jgi:hypothetical protein
MLDAIKPLLDSDLINEETRTAISEQWEAKLNEAREVVRAELREEFAQRYEHDKQVMVEALDRMVTEGLTAENQAVQAEKQALAEDRVKFNVKMKESATKFNDFMVSKLAEEIGELRKDRKVHTESINKLESFVVKALAQEIREFAQDKKDAVETKVRLVREARKQLEALKLVNSRKTSKLLVRTILVVVFLKRMPQNLVQLTSMRTQKSASSTASSLTKTRSCRKPSSSPRRPKPSLNQRIVRFA